MYVHDSDLDIPSQEFYLNGVKNSTLSTPIPLEVKKSESEEESQKDIPLAIRKGTRECTKRPYPLLHHMSYDQLSSDHKPFLSILLILMFPRTLPRHYLVKSGDK